MEKSTLEVQQQRAAMRGGKCLSTKYVNSVVKLEWECKEGHKWYAAPSRVQQGHWCSTCKSNKKSRVKYTLSDSQAQAERRGGECLSTKYVNVITKMEWRCQEGHTWKTTFSNVRKGMWCPICGHKNKRKKYTINDLQGWASEKNGKCLETEYKGNWVKMKWECEKGHVWMAKPLPIRKGKWCPYCRKNNAKQRKCYAIEDMQEIAKSRNGECLSSHFTTTKIKLKWKCHKGHIWMAKPEGIIYNSGWCPYCQHKTIEEMQELAARRGGKCLSHQYIKSNKHLQWQCDQGHIWRATPNNVTRGTWCPVCSDVIGGHKSRRFTIEQLQEIAAEKGGKCLSTEYKGIQVHLEWECGKGHTWRATPDNVSRGTWCPYCVKRKQLTIEEMQSLAQAKGGKCLSNVYENVGSYLEWECSCGYQWKAIPTCIKKGRWCPKCSQYRPLTIEEAQEIAASRGGKCLSSSVLHSSQYLLWECRRGHQWQTSFGSIKYSRSWCPRCPDKWKTEEKCRTIFEEIFDRKFFKTRQALGCRLELDGYCEELKLAFEYNGQQHYEICRFVDTSEKLAKLQSRDRRKVLLCKERNITLIIIPYTQNHRLKEFIEHQLNFLPSPILTAV